MENLQKGDFYKIVKCSEQELVDGGLFYVALTSLISSSEIEKTHLVELKGMNIKFLKNVR
jgi:hypothetical protein